MASSLPTDQRLQALRQFGTDAVSFQGLETANLWWQDEAPPEGTGSSIAYLDTGHSWIAVGSPLVEVGRRSAAAARFAAAAHAARRRAVFFGVESLEPFRQFRQLALGSQAVFSPEHWRVATRRRRLREQLRRARAKGVTVRRVDPAELADGTPFRETIERLRVEWLRTRPMEPMGFLVEVEPFHEPGEHLYIVAERNGVPVEFVSAVPIYARGGWLIEDVLRSHSAPNGTTELVLDAVLRAVAPGADPVTPGLTPLAGAVSWPMRMLRSVTVPLYDFSGLERFRRRLSPVRWDPVYLVWDRGAAPLVVLDVLRAFSRLRLASFAWRSLVRHPNGPPFVVAVPLVPWTLLLAALSATGHAGLLGFSQPALHAWVAFDLVLAWLLFHGAHRPRLWRLAGLTGAAAADATLSIRHLATHGAGTTLLEFALRSVATAGPVMGTLALAWATTRAARVRAQTRPA